MGPSRAGPRTVGVEGLLGRTKTHTARAPTPSRREVATSRTVTLLGDSSRPTHPPPPIRLTPASSHW